MVRVRVMVRVMVRVIVVSVLCTLKVSGYERNMFNIYAQFLILDETY